MLVWALALSFAYGGCSSDDNAGESVDPLIKKLSYLGERINGNQVPSVRFLIEFSDKDGDLGGGRLLIKRGCAVAEPQDLRTLFDAQTVVLPENAKSGSFELSLDAPNGLKTSDATEFGFLLQDERGHLSNEAVLVLSPKSGRE